MRRLKLTLAGKGLAYTGVLLVFECALLGALRYLWLQSEYQARQAERSKNIVVEGSLVVKLVYDATAELGAYILTKNDAIFQRYQLSVDEFPIHLKELKELAIQDQSGFDSKLSEQISRDADSTIAALDLARRKELSGKLRTQEVVRILESDLQPAAKKLTTDIRILVTRHKTDNEHSALALAGSADEMLGQLLLAAVLANIIFAVGTVLLFFRNVASRLQVMTDNSRRLAQGKPLHRPISGTDELSLLDSTFHTMAAALAAAIEKDRAIVDNMPVGFLTLSEAGLIQAANPKVSALLSYPPNELVGKDFIDFVAASSQTRHDAATPRANAWAALRDSLINRVAELKLRTSGDEEIPVEVSMAVLKQDGNTMLICNLLDVREKHEIERLKRKFVAIVSHDLGNPLSSINAAMKLLAIGELDDEQRESVDIAVRESARLIRLTRDLLDFGRLDARRMQINRSPCLVAELIDTAVASLRSIAHESGVALEASGDPIEQPVNLDADRILQVLNNLIANAIQHSPRESIVTVSASTNLRTVSFNVEDGGPGIADIDASMIFEPFRQASSGAAKTGTGLGLSIAKMIVEAHGGTIAVSARKPTGTKFSFTVPCTLEAELDDDGSAIAAAAATTEQGRVDWLVETNSLSRSEQSGRVTSELQPGVASRELDSRETISQADSASGGQSSNGAANREPEPTATNQNVSGENAAGTNLGANRIETAHTPQNATHELPTARSLLAMGSLVVAMSLVTAFLYKALFLRPTAIESLPLGASRTTDTAPRTGAQTLPDADDIIASQANMESAIQKATVLFQKRRYTEAEPIFEACAHQMQLSKQTSKDLLPVLQNLGQMYFVQGRFKESAERWRSAMNTVHELHKDGTMEDASATADLAAVVVRQQNFAEANKLYTHELEVLDRLHADPRDALMQRTMVLSNLGRFTESEQDSARLLNENEKLKSKTDPNAGFDFRTAGTYWLAKAKLDLHQAVESEKLMSTLFADERSYKSPSLSELCRLQFEILTALHKTDRCKAFYVDAIQKAELVKNQQACTELRADLSRFNQRDHAAH